MKTPKTYIRAALTAALFLTLTGHARAQTSTASGTITKVRTAWQDESYVIDHSSTPISVSGCATDGYASSASTAGYKTQLQVALLAFAADMPVTVTVSAVANDCVLGRPRILAVNVSK